MADGREQGVWSEHALRDHAKQKPYTHAGALTNLLKLTDKVKTVWDLGCGSGLWRPIFKDYSYVGVDQNTEMLSVANSRDFKDIKKPTMFVQSNLRNFSEEVLALKKPDLIWLSAVLQHNRHDPDKTEILKNIAKVLSKGKYLMFTENTFTEKNYNPPFLRFEEGCSDGWSFTQKGWKEYIEKFGFKLVENYPFNFYLFEKL